MSIAGRIGATALAATMGAATSQAPEFTQQYRQRLGGALDELARVIAQFDSDAASEGLDRDGALVRYETSGDDFLTRRGGSVRGDVERLEYLTAHAAELEATPPTVRPLLILREGDRPIIGATLGVYEPALPLTASGATYGVSGIVAALLAWWGGASAGRAATRRRRSPSRRREPEFAAPTNALEPELTELDAIVPGEHDTDERRSRRVALVRKSRDTGADTNRDVGRDPGPIQEGTP